MKEAKRLEKRLKRRNKLKNDVLQRRAEQMRKNLWLRRAPRYCYTLNEHV